MNPLPFISVGDAGVMVLGYFIAWGVHFLRSGIRAVMRAAGGRGDPSISIEP